MAGFFFDFDVTAAVVALDVVLAVSDVAEVAVLVVVGVAVDVAATDVVALVDTLGRGVDSLLLAAPTVRVAAAATEGVRPRFALAAAPATPLMTAAQINSTTSHLS